jgi:hypothetical protein
MPIGNTPREIHRVVLGLEADQIVGAQLRDQPFVVRQRRENLRRRKRHVQEVADAVAMAAIAQHLGERNEMIVVHPDHIVGLEEIVQLIGEMRIDAAVTAEIAARELGKIEPIMQDRPQHPVGEAVVVFLIIRLGQIGHDVGHVALIDGMGRDLAVGRDGAAPAEPDTAVLLEQRTYGDGEPAGLVAAILARDGHTIRNDDQPRQYRSSQLRESRIADRMRPAIE